MPSRYISELLKKNNRAIVPQFGAFVLKKQDGKDIVSFNSILKFDDGNLSGIIEEKEKLSKEDAKKKVEEYSKQLQSEVGSGKQVEIPGVGKIYKDANGRIQIIDSSSKQPESKPVERKEVPKVEEKKEVDSAKQVTPPTPKATPTPEQKSTPTTAAAGSSGQAKTLNDKLKESKATATTSTAASGTTTKPNVAKPSSSSKTPPPPSGTKQKKGKGFLWISLIVILLAAGATAYLLFFSNPKDDSLHSSLKEDAALTESIEDKELEYEELSNDSIYSEEDTSNINNETEALSNEAVQDEATSIEETESNSVSSTGTKYYIVAGCFQVESNADRYVEKLKNEGYNSKKFGFLRGMHAVSYSEFDTRTEALNELQKIRSSREPNAWLIKY